MIHRFSRCNRFAFAPPVPFRSFPPQFSQRHASPQQRFIRYFRRALLTMSDPPPSTSPQGSNPNPLVTPTEDPTVQYVVVRRDLLSIWPTGSVIAQAVHASVAAIWSSRSDAHTLTYCNQPGNHSQASSFSPQMHTVVLEAKNEQALLKLADRLSQNNIRFVLWREQPEDFCTALAASPYPRSIVKPHFSKFKLFK